MTPKATNRAPSRGDSGCSKAAPTARPSPAHVRAGSSRRGRRGTGRRPARRSRGRWGPGAGQDQAVEGRLRSHLEQEQPHAHKVEQDAACGSAKQGEQGSAAAEGAIEDCDHPHHQQKPSGMVPGVSREQIRGQAADEGPGRPRHPREDSHNDHGRENEIRSHIARGRRCGEAGVDQACGESEKRAEDVDLIGFPGRFRCGCGMGKYSTMWRDGRCAGGVVAMFHVKH